MSRLADAIANVTNAWVDPMTVYSREELRLIRQLLHDAQLEEIDWDQSLAMFTARFNCLRRHVDGSELEDRIVELNLADVEGIAIGYDSASLEARPSQFKLPRRITAAELSDWSFQPQEANLWINSKIFEDVLAFARVEWLEGDELGLKNAANSICLFFDQWRDFGMPLIRIGLVVAGGSFTIISGGVPLELDDWEKQHAAWWKAWRSHWAAKTDDDDEETEPSEFEAAIPAGTPDPPNLDDRPPAEPPFSLEPTDTPAELLQALQDWFESNLNRDWLCMAHVYPHSDRTLEEQAAELEAQKLGYDFGRWGYARSVDRWWMEGMRACVVVRGIEHTAPLEGSAAANEETVWTYYLRKRSDQWTIYSFSQAWPQFGSAELLPRESKPWLDRWKSGNVNSAGMFFLIFDVTPGLSHASRDEIAGASVACWMDLPTQDEAKTAATKIIVEVGWVVGEPEEVKMVCRGTYRGNPEGLQRYEQALIDRTVCVFYTYPHE